MNEFVISGLYLISFLYLIAEECRKDDGGTDNEQTRTYQCHYGFCDSIFPGIHLDVDLEGGHDGQDAGNGVAQIKDIQHHRHHIVVHRGESVCTPTVIYSAAFGKGGIWDCST